MSQSSTCLRFDSKLPETWASFIRRFKFHVDSKGNISNEQKRGMLLDALDDRTVDRLDQWMSPIGLSTATYAALLATLEARMTHTVNSTIQYVNFINRKQLPGESHATFSEDLSRLAGLFGVAACATCCVCTSSWPGYKMQYCKISSLQ